MNEIFKKIDKVSAVEKVESIDVFQREQLKSETRFSILIPTYKRPNTLKETIESALAQVGFSDYDIIVVDNNPERGDETETLMHQYQNVKKVFYYKNSKNVGMAGNWNIAFLLSHSTNVILVHDDDIISPYALKIFDKVLEDLPIDWAVYKPQNKRFCNISELKFCDYSKTKLRKLTTFHFFPGSAIDAPTIILLNRDKMIEMGGVKNEYFPCIDYMMSLQATYFYKTYVSYDMVLGGYRVALNESLSEKTMDSYFIQTTKISNIVMRHYHVPTWLRRVVHTFTFVDVYRFVKDFYNMPDYTFELPKNETIRMSNIQIRLFKKFYRSILRIINIFNSKTIVFNK